VENILLLDTRLCRYVALGHSCCAVFVSFYLSAKWMGGCVPAGFRALPRSQNFGFHPIMIDRISKRSTKDRLGVQCIFWICSNVWVWKAIPRTTRDEGSASFCLLVYGTCTVPYLHHNHSQTNDHLVPYNHTATVSLFLKVSCDSWRRPSKVACEQTP